MSGVVAIVADRIGWEERELMRRLADGDIRAQWRNDESMTLGVPPDETLREIELALIRSRSYTRGGLLAGVLEASGVRTVNTADAVHMCENKLTLRRVLYRVGVPVPEFRLVLSRKDFRTALEQLPLPLVIKPVFGGMGRRVFLVHERRTAQSFYDYIEDLGHSFEQASLVERYLGQRSIRCFVVGREIVAAAEFESTGSDEWRSNAAVGSRQRYVGHGGDIENIVDKVVGVLGPGIYGVDLFEGPDGPVVNEVNHAPAFRAMAAATGIDIAAAVGDHLRGLLT
ncbi:RimK family alpha-L-glutamate ligase [Nocardia sp. CDC159]|uniref:RimK family alpha-L-glutamate ligase n=1 Tax=Nocardia pulmonis TaxID=2951408 RepID=A0A9X2E942_9NOCA|nr:MULTISPECIES: RimK family alpha-L-glutamate ligase [Nocardia]MCM6775895.1 RimK family alpha-L-glutamate ligase [Nocardia pulmonis]MCM6788129.1 RimK family alpha-L-glutamate ligase [Nocardia sp. CDC159]